jgi:hypothetical protein
VAVVLFAGSGGLMLILSLFLQLGLHYSALHTGLALTPVAVGIAASSLLVRLCPRVSAAACFTSDSVWNYSECSDSPSWRPPARRTGRSPPRVW